MTSWDALANIRREYGNLSLSEKEANDCPIAQFKHWFSEVLTSEKSDPTAMVLATVDEAGHPDTRVVLLKAIMDGSFVFYTNYQSVKAIQLNATPYAALNFYWPEMVRQVRVRGRVKMTSASMSDEYFASRPLESQLSAIASPQSAEITDRLVLEESLNRLIAEHQQALVVRPNHWGGYLVLPEEFEFWQGRENRLHDRIHYYQAQGQWIHRRLAP